jgi:hypothetical protein
MNRKRQSTDFIKTGPAPVREFGTGEAAEILEIPIWRLQKFLDSRQYNLAAEGRLGRGRGSRRVFRKADLHRIALANRLVNDGFAPQFIGSVVQQLDDDDVIGMYIDQEGEDTETSLCMAFYRGKDGPSVRFYYVPRIPALGQKDSPFYRLDLDDVFRKVDQKIE